MLEIVATKTCARCKEDRPISDYSKRAKVNDGLHPYCRSCLSFVNQEARLVAKGLLVRVPKRPATSKPCARCKQVLPIDAFYANRTTGRADCWCPPCWSEYSRDRVRNNPAAAESQRGQRAAWRAKNPEAAAAIHKRYRERHPERVRDWHRQWMAANPERVRAHGSKRRAIKTGSLPAATFTPSQLDARMAFFGYRCWMCRGPFEHIDHVKPLSKGGPHMLANLRPACSRCNNAKHAKWFGVPNLRRFIRP